MCGRYALKITIEELIERYGVTEYDFDINPREEIFPTDWAPVLLENEGKRKISKLKWGFKPPFTSRPIINARGETLDQKSIFRKSFLSRRCIIPASAFFEWKKEGPEKVKYRIFHKDNKIISLAGIFDTFTSENGERLNCFTIITTSPAGQLKEIHERMPVILEKGEEKYWLDNSNSDQEYLKKMLKPYPGRLVIEPENQQLSLDFD